MWIKKRDMLNFNIKLIKYFIKKHEVKLDKAEILARTDQGDAQTTTLWENGEYVLNLSYSKQEVYDLLESTIVLQEEGESEELDRRLEALFPYALLPTGIVPVLKLYFKDKRPPKQFVVQLDADATMFLTQEFRNAGNLKCN